MILCKTNVRLFETGEDFPYEIEQVAREHGIADKTERCTSSVFEKQATAIARQKAIRPQVAQRASESRSVYTNIIAKMRANVPSSHRGPRLIVQLYLNLSGSCS
jgi:hypothetical protein